MTIDFIGMIAHRLASETIPARGPIVDLDYVRRFAQAHEAAGFDRILVAHHSDAPDGAQIAAYAASVTQRLGLMIAHRPGFVAPTYAARNFATLDHVTGGRVAVHIISGGDDAEQRRDGDYLTHDERYERTDEFVTLLRRTWTSEKPFDFSGKYYRVDGAFSQVKPLQTPSIPVYFGGSSDAAVEIAGKHADIYALWGETLAQVRETVTRVRAAAAKHGRQVRFSLSLRPILAGTEEAAWKRADEILERIRAVRAEAGLGAADLKPANTGSQRLLAAAAQGARLDKRLWTAAAAATGARGNSTSLVGTPEQVAEGLLDYFDLGVTTFLIRGFDPLEDAIDYGRELIPLTRRLAADRARSRGVSAAE
ncbi:MAG TPA: LLM class flavin-dependent oxidoreductase [Hypericibacter adhaerens]|jgi:alkanesulfonate monooxygenase|uniref:Alkanesulfonate monooxygenase n=1 Tax=Hypericibacter adhaerens TaxID=2602016 RepID=A0A5J6MV54_9PROT|nr:LLM class flavin-dependent oxidoreductase [Hypericibacter adhaerens]QEX21067.1 alkanesulfonate monooxygenase [Hypericibacter adhaerens]HWA46381.1 LLM class flavin-dependent oxidoreductase [Hypericibacter adhaerens]